MSKLKLILGTMEMGRSALSADSLVSGEDTLIL